MEETHQLLGYLSILSWTNMHYSSGYNLTIYKPQAILFNYTPHLKKDLSAIYTISYLPITKEINTDLNKCQKCDVQIIPLIICS